VVLVIKSWIVQWLQGECIERQNRSVAGTVAPPLPRPSTGEGASWMHRMVNTMGSGKMRSDPCHGFFHALRCRWH